MSTQSNLKSKNSNKVTNLATGASFEVPSGDLLLVSALQQGLNYPHNCRVGTCGSCKTKLVSGRISPLVDFAMSPLSNRELEDGYILACQSKVRTDLDIEIEMLDYETIPPKMIAGEISSWSRLPGDVIHVRFKVEEAVRFQAGQYTSISVSGSFVRRMFSYYDQPKEAGNDEVGFLVKLLPGGKFSQWLYDEDRRGVRVWLEGPYGQMGLDEQPRDALCVAGGTGIAPILSIARQRLSCFAKSNVTIVFGVREEKDLFAQNMLGALEAEFPERLRIVLILSHESQDSSWRGARGLVTQALSPELGIDYANCSAFICGSVPMVEAVEKICRALGIGDKFIHADKFEPAAV